ncbi:hypothetical protein BUE76_22080 [Cnuella takakiae]|nr:hypothetical protein BUE76_22080 [Cnuella takakiae]
MSRGCLGMFRNEITGDLSNSTVPTLITGASKDRLTRPDASAYMGDHWQNAELMMVAPGNPQGLLESHRDVNEAAARLFQKLKGNVSGCQKLFPMCCCGAD